MPFVPITTLPTPPSRLQPSVFSERTDTFLAALTTFQTQLNEAGDYVESIEVRLDEGEAASQAAIDAAEAAATSEINAATSETNAATSETNASASFASFDKRYLGAKSSAPTVDNEGNALIVGAIYFLTSNDSLYIWDGSAWKDAVFQIDTVGAVLVANNLSDLNDVVQARLNLGIINATEAEVKYQITSSAVTAVKYQKIAINAASSYTINLPASPTSGEWVQFSISSGDATVNNITLSGNGKNINGSSTLTVDLNYVTLILIYNGTEWRIS